MDPRMTFFKPIQDHFDLFGPGLKHPSYMDFLLPDIPYLYGTFKCHNGNSGIILRKEHQLPADMEVTEAQKNLYVKKSQDIDIITNTMNLICYRNDIQNPMVEYEMLIEGNPKLQSVFSAVRNMIPSQPDRPFVNSDGIQPLDPNTGQPKLVRPGENDNHWPYREDFTLLILQVKQLNSKT